MYSRPPVRQGMLLIPGASGELPYISYIGICGPKGMFLSCFTHKMCIDFGHFVINRVWLLGTVSELGMKKLEGTKKLVFI